MILLNSTNETLRAIKNHKEKLKLKRDKIIERINEQYSRDMELLNKEEQELLKQFKDVPYSKIYGEDSDD